MIDNTTLDVHVGSIAIRRFIEKRQPLITLHGHIHESARLTGSWRERLGRTWAFSAAHDGAELALVRFDPADPERATRVLI
jgi:Icc-related predicted phosphoesterase